jgi:hypothetical protein
MSRVPANLVLQVRTRAQHRCEYCHLPEFSTQLPFEVEHIIPVKHKGSTTSSNLAFACLHCNRHKSVNIAGFIHSGRRIVRLFHPRRDVWREHFRMKDGHIIARTTIGTVTIDVLDLNDEKQVLLRRFWLR